MSDLEVLRGIKRDLIRMRKQIEAMNGEEKKRAWKAYAELLTSLEIGRYNSHPLSGQSAHKSA